MTSAVGKELASTVFNATGGFFGGIFIDHWAPAPASVDESNWLRVFGEVAIQLTANGIVSSAVQDFGTRRGISSGNATNNALIYIMTTLASQPELTQKIALLAGFFKNKTWEWLSMGGLSKDDSAGSTQVKSVRNTGATPGY